MPKNTRALSSCLCAAQALFLIIQEFCIGSRAKTAEYSISFLITVLNNQRTHLTARFSY